MISYFFQGDAPFYFDSQLPFLGLFPRVFLPEYALGLNVVYRLWYDYPIQLFINFLHTIGFSWFIIDKFLWFGLIFLGVFSLYKFLSSYFSRWLSIVGILIYLVNTYSILILSGGQLGIFASYAISPFVLHLYFRTIEGNRKGLSNLIANGFAFAGLLMCDLRIAVIVFTVIALYAIYSNFLTRMAISVRVSILLNFFWTILISLLAHAYWIIPMVFFPSIQNSLGETYTSLGMVKFLSVADFSHTISLLHPNWPENLFGKTYFMQPEFLLLPIIASFSIFFVSKRKQRINTNIPFFLGLLFFGAFLSKGLLEPMGGVFGWAFEHVPGFVLFRDPTKFYILVALGYSVLIPYVLDGIRRRLESNANRGYLGIIGKSTLLLFIIYWVFTIRFLFLGSVSGNLNPKPIPEIYRDFAQYLSEDVKFSRVLWIPLADKPVFSSPLHPIITFQDLYGTSSASGKILQIPQKEFKEKISEAGIGYIGVPFDIERKVFLRNYSYDPKSKNELIGMINVLDFEPVMQTGEMNIWKTKTHKPLVSFVENNTEIAPQYSLEKINSGMISVRIPDNKTGSIVLRYSFDPYWVCRMGNTIIQPKKTKTGFIEFPIKSGTSQTGQLTYLPQEWSIYGLYLGWGGIIVIFLFGIVLPAVKSRSNK